MWKNIIQLNKKVYINQALIYIIKQGFNFRAANIPAKYETKIVNNSGEILGHAWHLVYINNKWQPGESTDWVTRPDYGKSTTLYDVYINANPHLNCHKITYSFISKLCFI